MLGMAPAGVRTAVDRLDTHLAHQRRHVLAPDCEALLEQQIAQHPAAGERQLQMQLVDPAHEPQVGVRDGTGE